MSNISIIHYKTGKAPTFEAFPTRSQAVKQYYHLKENTDITIKDLRDAITDVPTNDRVKFIERLNQIFGTEK